MVVAPLAAMLGQMAISRTREYSADRRGAEICGNPIWLASALGKIAGAAQVIHNDDAERNPATAHMLIINPLSGERLDNLFSTHPNTENRISALHPMDGDFAAGGSKEPFGANRTAGTTRPVQNSGRGSSIPPKSPWPQTQKN